MLKRSKKGWAAVFEAEENCAVLDYCATSSGNSLPTLRTTCRPHLQRSRNLNLEDWHTNSSGLNSSISKHKNIIKPNRTRTDFRVRGLDKNPGWWKYYRPKGRRNQGRSLLRLMDVWDRTGSTSGPAPCSYMMTMMMMMMMVVVVMMLMKDIPFYT
jgi:hypothetical protein